MNYQNKSYRLIALTGLFVIAFGWSGCKVEPIPDPNNPGTGGITQNASVSPIPVIRNEELILICRSTDAVKSSSRRSCCYKQNSYGCQPAALSGAVNQNSLITEILKQRRYSLFGEGHRWIDMRRYNLLSQLPIDRPGDDVWPEFPRPATEPQQ